MENLSLTKGHPQVNRNPLKALFTGLAFVGIVITIGIILTALAGCENRTNVHCKDNTTIYTQNPRHACDNHGGRALKTEAAL